MVEYHHTLRSGGFFHQPLDFRIVRPLNFGVVVEVPDGGIVIDQLKALTVERKLTGHRAAIQDRHRFLDVLARAHRHAFRRLVEVCHRPLTPIGQIAKEGLHVIKVCRGATASAGIHKFTLQRIRAR
jgi:hypothetical protein